MLKPCSCGSVETITFGINTVALFRQCVKCGISSCGTTKEKRDINWNYRKKEKTNIKENQINLFKQVES
jgi:hypothetical protein